MKNLRKAFTVGVMSVTVLSMSMLAVPFTVGAVSEMLTRQFQILDGGGNGIT